MELAWMMIFYLVFLQIISGYLYVNWATRIFKKIKSINPIKNFIGDWIAYGLTALAIGIVMSIIVIAFVYIMFSGVGNGIEYVDVYSMITPLMG